MIIYNIRYRGEYEYDKFVLNIMQLHNEAKLLIGKYIDGEYDELKRQEHLIDSYINIEDMEKLLKLKLMLYS